MSPTASPTATPVPLSPGTGSGIGIPDTTSTITSPTTSSGRRRNGRPGTDNPRPAAQEQGVTGGYTPEADVVFNIGESSSNINNIIEVDVIIEEVNRVLTDHETADIEVIIEKITQALLGLTFIDINEAFEKIAQILLNQGIVEIDYILEEIAEILLLLSFDIFEELIQTWPTNDIIRVPIGREVIYRMNGVNWIEIPMDTTAFVSEQGSIMIPLRFLTYALRENVQWEIDSALAILSSPLGDILVAPGQTEMTINGSSVTIADRFGNVVAASLRNDRIMIPMSALANAFNIEYRWDPITQEAVFYPFRPLQQQMEDGILPVNPNG